MPSLVKSAEFEVHGFRQAPRIASYAKCDNSLGNPRQDQPRHRPPKQTALHAKVWQPFADTLFDGAICANFRGALYTLYAKRAASVTVKLVNSGWQGVGSKWICRPGHPCPNVILIGDSQLPARVAAKTALRLDERFDEFLRTCCVLGELAISGASCEEYRVMAHHWVIAGLKSEGGGVAEIWPEWPMVGIWTNTGAFVTTPAGRDRSGFRRPGTSAYACGPSDGAVPLMFIQLRRNFGRQAAHATGGRSRCVESLALTGGSAQRA